MTTKPHPVDIAAILAFFAGLGGFTTILAGLFPPEDHTFRVIVAIISSVVFFSGLALRVFFNQTSATVATVPNMAGQPVSVAVDPAPGLTPK